MKAVRVLAWCLVAAALVCGVISDAPPVRGPLFLGGYRVLGADFHVHTFPLSAATLAPWDVVIEARHQGLDAIAITGHNQVLSAKVGRWFSRLAGGPTVLAGEEVHAPDYHLIAAGIDRTISWRLSAAAAIDEAHRQGGVAIAAHPVTDSRTGWTPEAVRKLDGSEVLQPVAWTSASAARDLREFYRRAPMAAIGSSDSHGPGPLGACRTYVFARDESEESILDAIRARRTVVFDRGAVFGDPAMIALAAGRLPESPPTSGRLAAISRICGVLGLVGAIFLGPRMDRECAGINRHGIGDERVLQEGNSEPS